MEGMIDPSNITELDLVVGSLITMLPDEDRATFEEEQEAVSQLQDLLREEGLAIDLLAQPGTEVWEGGIETLGALYQLSRLATYLERGETIAQVLEDGPVLYDELDPSVTNVWDAQSTTRFPHLVNLQGVNSYYLPVDFDEPIILTFENEDGEQDDAFFGSSIRLQRELTDLAELLGQAQVSVQTAAYRCLEALREASNQSVRHNLPLIIW